MADSITGQCGDSLYWFFDTETHHLDLTGKGKMNLNKYSAWTTKNITIHSISFSDSITSIDNYAFEEQALTEVVIPASVKKFGSRAFADNHSLLRFEYNGEGYCEIGDKVLYNCKNLRYFKGAIKMLAYNDALDTVIVTYGYALTNFYERTYIDNTLAYDTRLSGKYDERPKKIKTFFFPSQIEVIGDYLLCNAVELPSPATYVDKVPVQYNAAKKVFLNGQLLIINDDIIYNIMGQKLPLLLSRSSI